MRTKTDQRRQAIVDHAAAIFRDTGYDRTSMAQIAASVGGSKTTLYGYFRSKEELFAAVMAGAVEAHCDALVAIIDQGTAEPRAALLAFGRAYLDLVLSPDIVAVTRIGIAEGEKKGIGPALYAMGPGRGWTLIAEHLQGWIDRGVLRPIAPARLALDLRGLLEAGVVEPRLYGAEPLFDIDRAAADAIDAFLRAYGTGTLS